MKTNLLVFSLLFHLLIAPAFLKAQTISYPAPASPVSVGYDSTLLTVQVTGASANPTITISLPVGIYYVAGSFRFTSGNATVTESGTLTVPVFKLTGASNPFVFTIKRRADCNARTFGLSGGTFKDVVTVDAVTENTPLLNTYSIKYPTLTITQPASLTNVTVGSNFVRTFSFRNSGQGCIDTVFLDIDYGSSGLVPNGDITADGVSFSPDVTLSTLTKKRYKIFGTPAMRDGLCNSDSSIAVSQPVTVTGCNQAATNYTASWGTSGLQLCQGGTTSGNLTVLNTIPLLTSVVTANPAAIPFCAANPYASFTASVTNTGNGPATGVKFYLGNFSGNTFQSGVPLAVDTASVLVNGIHPVNILVSVSPSWRLTKANGSPACIVGQPGQCLVTMPPGFSVPAAGTFNVQWKVYNCGGGACDDGFIASNPGIKLEYDNACGTQHTSNQAQITPYGINNQITNQAVQLPAQVIAGDCFDYLVDFTAVLNPVFGSNSMNRCADVKLTLPVGMSIGNLSTDIYETINNQLPHTGFPKQVGQDVYFRFYPIATSQVKFRICTTPGGPPCGNTSIPVEISMVNDSTCAPANRITSRRCLSKTIEVLCPGALCAMGGVTMKTFNFFRSSLGLPDNNQDGKPDASGGVDLTKIDHDRYRPGDTLHSEYRGLVINQTSPANITNWNYLLADWSFNAGTWQGATATITIKRAGSTYIATGVPVTALTATRIFRADWSNAVFSPTFPAGGYFADDSIIVVADFIYLPPMVTSGKTTTVADGNVDVPLEVLLTHVVYAAQSLPATPVVIGTNGFTCSILKYNSYTIGHSNLINLSGATGSSCNNITSGFSCFTSMLNGSQSKQFFLYEYRPVLRTDSVIYTIPAGWKYVGAAASPYNFTVRSGVYSTFSGILTPVITGNAADGYSLKYDVHSAFDNGTFPLIGTEGLNYNGNILFAPGCNTPDSATISVKEYGHFISYPNKTNPAAYVNTNTSVKAITYSGSSKPGVAIANNTGIVEAATKTGNYWDVQITGTNFNAAKFVWLATEKLVGSGIDVIRVECPLGNALPATSYGTNKNIYHVNSTAVTGLINPNNLIVRVYFSKSGCGTDSLKVRTGWDCSNFATSADNGCSQDLFLKAKSALSEIQLLKITEPAPNATTNICNDIDYRIKITSTQNGDVDNPVVMVTMPQGMEMVNNSFSCTYPDTSNTQQLTASVAGNIYTLNLKDHALLSSSGLKGLISASGTADRTSYVSMKLRVNSCAFVNGSSPTFQIFGDRPCGGTVVGNSLTVIGNPIQASSEASVAMLTGAFSLSGGSSIVCESPITVNAEVSSADGNSFDGDSVVYTLPTELKFKAGSLKINAGTISNATQCDNRISVSLPDKINNNLSLQFDVVSADKGCSSQSYKLIANTYRSVGYKCFATFGSCQQPQVTDRDTANLQLVRPQLATSAFSFLQTGQVGDIAVNYSVDISNSGNLTATAGNYLVNIYCGSNANGKLLHSFYNDAIDVVSTVTHTGTFMVNLPGECFSGTPFFIQVQDTIANSVKACLCSAPFGNISGRVLPVKLESFTVAPKGGMVEFNWVVNEEINIATYEIEYSQDAMHFTTIETVKAVHNRYYSKAHGVPNGRAWYRLKTMDEDGKYSYSVVRMINFSSGSQAIIYPNPAKDVIKITLKGAMVNKSVDISLISMDGKVVTTLKIASAKQAISMNIANIASGKYQLIVKTDTELINKTIDVLP